MKKLYLVYLIIFLPVISFCQTEKQLVPADLKQQTIVTEPVTLQKGFFRTGIILNYRVADKYFDKSGKKEYFLTSSWGSTSAYGVTLQYGLTDRLQIDLKTEYRNTLKEIQNTEIIASTNTSIIKTTKQKGLGLGDSHLSITYQILQEIEKRMSLTSRVNLTIPTGEKNPTNIRSAEKYDLPVGEGTYALGINISARKILYPYSLAGYLEYKHNFKGTKKFTATDIDEITFRLGDRFESGLSINLLLNEWIVLANEINFSDKGKGEIETVINQEIPSEWALSYEPGLVFQVKRFRLSESVRIPVIGRNVPADPLYELMIQYLF